MLLMLSPSALKQQALKQFLEQQQNPASTNYHHWLSPSEFGAKFGTDTSDLQRASSWLQASGFTITAMAKGGGWIEFGGTSGQVENAFRTELHYFRLAGKQYLANATDISLPASVAQISRGLVSLNNFPNRPPTQFFGGVAGVNEQGQKVKLTPNLTAAGATNTYYVAPGDFALIYNTKPLLTGGMDGSGVTIAVTAQSQIELSDVQEFRKIFGLKVNDPNILVSGPDPGITNPIDAQEATLDAEWAGAIAPGATIDLVIAGSTNSTNGVDLAAAYAIDNQIAPILTYTYGSCESALQPSGNSFYNALWQQAAAEGVTVLVATGDNGSAACDASGSAATQGKAVNGAASTPFNVAVGGTQFNDTGNQPNYWNATNNSDYSSAIGYITEAAWNESCDPTQPNSPTNCVFATANFSSLASGGGASTVYTKPSWQAGTGVPSDGFRDVPDVALASAVTHESFVYCYSAGLIPGIPICELDSQNNLVGLTLVGGTSASTPAMAGILALVEQENGAYQGQINYTLYKLAQNTGASCDSSKQTSPGAQNACLFYDVTTGSNAVPCLGGSPDCSSSQIGVNGFITGEAAGPGYDLVTGLGSINAANLANNWNSVRFLPSQTQLQVPTTAFAHGTAVSVSGNVAPASGSGTPTGSIALKTDTYGNADVLALTSSGAFTSSSISDLPGGQYNLVAHYSGDGTYAPSDSTAIALTVTPENSTTTLTATGLQGGSAPYGNPIQLFVKVQGLSSAGNATGNVTVLDGSTTIGTYSLASDGTAFINTGSGSPYSFSVGSHSLTASYSADNSFNASASSALPFTIGKSTPTVIVGLNSSTVSTTQPIGAHVDVAGFGTALATGTVQFTVDSTLYGVALPLESGGLFGTQAQASTLITGLSAGAHLIGVNYDSGADPNYLSVKDGDQNNRQTVTVTAASGAASTTTLTAQNPPVNLGDTGTFVVNVSPTTATGTVTLWDEVGARTSATPIANGTATIQVGWTQAGSFTLYAVYGGDRKVASSSSSPVSFSVKQGNPVVVLAVPGQTNINQQISIVGTVTGTDSTGKPIGSGLPSPTGVVEFWDSLNGGAMQLLSTESLTPGAGRVGSSAIREKMAAGTHALKMHYEGDLNWAAMDSPTVTVATLQSIAVTPTSPSIAMGTTQQFTATGTYSDSTTANITGSVTWGSATPSVATITPGGLATAASVGTSTISATSGAVTGSTVLAVTAGATPDFTLSLLPNPVSFTAGSPGSTTVTVTPSGGFSGNVTLSCPTGSGFPIAGYSCSFMPASAIVDISGPNAGTAVLNISPTATNTARIFPSLKSGPRNSSLWGICLLTGLILLVTLLVGQDRFDPRRQLIFASGCILLVASLVLGCGGGGGGGGGGPVPSTTALTTSSHRASYQTPLIFSVRVNASSTPSGTIQLLDNGQLYSSGTVSAGVATFQTTTLPVGVHVLTAQYSGDAHTQPSNSLPITQTIVGNVQFPLTGTASSGAHITTVSVSVN